MPQVTITSLDVPHTPLSVKSAELYHHIYCKPISQSQALPTSCQRGENQQQQKTPKQNRLRLYCFPTTTGVPTSQKTLNRPSFSSNLLNYVAAILPSALINNQQHFLKYISFPSILKENRMCLGAKTSTNHTIIFLHKRA